MSQSNDTTHPRERVNALPEWPALIGRAVEDLSCILHGEVRLLELGIKSTVQREIDRAIIAALALATLLLGLGCLTAAAILGLHEVLRTAWWAAFAIVAGVALVGGVGIWLWSEQRSPRTAYSTANSTDQRPASNSLE